MYNGYAILSLISFVVILYVLYSLNDLFYLCETLFENIFYRILYFIIAILDLSLLYFAIGLFLQHNNFLWILNYV